MSKLVLPSFHQIGDVVSLRLNGSYHAAVVERVTFDGASVLYDLLLAPGFTIREVGSSFVVHPQDGTTDELP